ncbi:MAG: HAMP domain-containing histidine kinase [Muribaculaceae bacterium]|nr:HAMP domain-containing histidine kinase [Muribaculaceae bacterium]
MLWTLAAVVIVYQYMHEVESRGEIIRKQVDLISKRILDAYTHNTDLRQYMNFVNNHFTKELLDDASLCVYDTQTGRLEYYAGLPVIQDFSDAAVRPEIEDAVKFGKGEVVTKDQDGTIFFYKALKSEDGKIIVHTSVPYTVQVIDALKSNSNFYWILLFIVLTATIIAYYSTRLLSKNISILRDFANNAADGKIEYDTSKFPHDELGDISRQIVKLYTEKSEAIVRSEREHEIALHAIKDKALTKKQLTNNINHELKTPIGVIKGYIDTIMSNPDMDEATKARFLSRTQENVERLCNLLSDVSEITRLEDGAGNIPVAEVDFHDLVYTIESDLRVSGLAGNMAFKYDIPLDCVVKGNAGLLSGLVSNLIKNAAQHSHGTEMGLRLVVESEKYYTFSFYDNGGGVDPEHLPHLFERFYRIDAGRSRKVGGTGLGLPIVKNTIEALGGSVSVHNRAGGGLEFLFTLKKWHT